MLSGLKRFIVGQPLATAQARHERLSKTTGLAIFASDNLSSVAYASEEVLRVLILAGVGALDLADRPADHGGHAVPRERRGHRRPLPSEGLIAAAAPGVSWGACSRIA